MLLQVNTLFVLMGEKKEDDEFVLQISFAFNKFMMYDATRQALLGSTQVVFYLVDLLQDKNKEVRAGCASHRCPTGSAPTSTRELRAPESSTVTLQVRRVADQCLDVIMDTDEEWAVRIRNLKFESFNQDWLDVVSAPPEQVRGPPGAAATAACCACAGGLPACQVWVTHPLTARLVRRV